MSGRPDLAAEAGHWLRFAREDLTDTLGLLERPDSTPRNVCWVALQAAEKAIKACLVFEGVRFPKTHDLDRLLRMLPAGWGLAGSAPEVSWLAGWSAGMRYPGDLDEATRADAERAAEIAAEVVRLASAELAARGVQAGREA